MFFGILSLILLWAGYKLYAPRLENNWQIDIHRTANIAAKGTLMLSYRHAQLVQLGIIVTIQSLWSAVMGVVYGPLQMIWIVLGTTFLGAVLNYYGGMYALTHQGHSLNYIIKEKNKRAHLISSLCLMAVFVLGTACVFSISYHIDFLFHKHSPIIYFYFVAMLLLSFCNQRKFIIAYSIFAFLFLAGSFYFIMLTAGEFQFATLNLNLAYYPETKFTYPLLFMAVSAGVMSGMDGLKGVLLAPHIKNEKMAKGIYFGAATAQATLVILWALMLLAWNPEFTWLNKFMQRAVNPYEVLQCRLLNHFNYWSALLLYLMTSILCIASGGTLLRLTGVLGRELGIEKDAARDFVPLGCFFLAFIIYYLSAKNWTGDGFFSLLGNNMRQIFAIGMNSFDLFNLLITVYVFALLTLYWRSRQKPFRKYVYIVAVLLGLALAYIIIMWLRWPYGIGVICGLALSLGLMAADFFYRRRQFR